MGSIPFGTQLWLEKREQGRSRALWHLLITLQFHTVKRPKIFFQDPRVTKTGLRNRIVREIGDKIGQGWGRTTTYGSQNRELRKIE